MPARSERWSGRIRASVAADADRVFEIVDTLDQLGFSTSLTHARGRWRVELRRTEAPTVELLRRVAAMFERAFPDRDAARLVVEIGGRTYRLGPRDAKENGAKGGGTR